MGTGWDKVRAWYCFLHILKYCTLHGLQTIVQREVCYCCMMWEINSHIDRHSCKQSKEIEFRGHTRLGNSVIESYNYHTIFEPVTFILQHWGAVETYTNKRPSRWVKVYYFCIYFVRITIGSSRINNKARWQSNKQGHHFVNNFFFKLNLPECNFMLFNFTHCYLLCADVLENCYLWLVTPSHTWNLL